jgi:uncharacterized membrane protein YgcG
MRAMALRFGRAAAAATAADDDAADGTQTTTAKAKAAAAAAEGVGSAIALVMCIRLFSLLCARDSHDRLYIFTHCINLLIINSHDRYSYLHTTLQVFGASLRLCKRWVHAHFLGSGGRTAAADDDTISCLIATDDNGGGGGGGGGGSGGGGDNTSGGGVGGGVSRASQCLCDEAIELLVAFVFASPQPFTAPGTAAGALLRFLSLLASCR